MTPTTQENSTLVPAFFTGMTLLQEIDCGGFDVQYYAHPEISISELLSPLSAKGFGSVVVSKSGSQLSQVLTRLAEVPKLGQNYVISHQAPNDVVRDITGNGLDGHRAPDAAYLQDSPLFNDDGVFPVQARYITILNQNTNGLYGPGELTIDDRVSQVFTADDGSTCTLKPPKVVVRIKP
ncbi:MAG: hypothetical protein ABJN34_07565 [Litoreibacter sp.]|uniref:hypothetical protein n=1 Tax=Litoreibacter sp. TaxID=1969459 RepID=UPI00329A2D69